MVIVKEFRIPLPLDVEEFRRGQLFAVSEACKNETGGGEGAEFIKQEDFTSTTLVPGETLTGIYTYKIYRLRSKAPWILQKTLPKEAFEIHEESWNAYPYCKTVLTNPGYMKEDFHLTVESTHLADNGNSNNPLGAPRKREIVHIDICDDSYLSRRDYKAETDPKVFKSKKTGRGQLGDEWQEEIQPVMCCYKVVTIHFKWTGFGGRVEKTIQKAYPKIFGKFHREAFCWIDRWYELTMEEIRELEEETAVQLRKQLKEPQKRGTSIDEDGGRKSSSLHSG